MIAAIARVPGVHRVEERLDRHEHPNGISGLQGGRFRTGERSELCQANWSPTAGCWSDQPAPLVAAAQETRRDRAGLGLGQDSWSVPSPTCP